LSVATKMNLDGAKFQTRKEFQSDN